MTPCRDLTALHSALVEVYRQTYGPYEPPQVETDDSHQWWFDRGLAFDGLGRPALAEAPFQSALERLIGVPGTEYSQAACQLNLGNVYNDTGRLTGAEAAYTGFSPLRAGGSPDLSFYR